MPLPAPLVLSAPSRWRPVAWSLLALALLPSRALPCTCSPGGLEVWPPEAGEIPTNVRLLLEGAGSWQPLVFDIGARAPALVAGEETVPLRVSAVHLGWLKVVQVALAPIRELKPKTRYKLVLTKGDSAEPWNPATSGGGQAHELAWRTGAGSEHLAPTWSGAPEVISGKRASSGCGTGAEVIIATPVKPGARVLVELRSLDGSVPPVRFVLPVTNDGRVHVGYGWCGGPFPLLPGVRYRTTLSAINPAGNSSPAPGPPIEFSGPREP
jgi:hypothetical protein